MIPVEAHEPLDLIPLGRDQVELLRRGLHAWAELEAHQRLIRLAVAALDLLAFHLDVARQRPERDAVLELVVHLDRLASNRHVPLLGDDAGDLPRRRRVVNSAVRTRCVVQARQEPARAVRRRRRRIGPLVVRGIGLDLERGRCRIAVVVPEAVVEARIGLLRRAVGMQLALLELAPDAQPLSRLPQHAETKVLILLVARRPLRRRTG